MSRSVPPRLDDLTNEGLREFVTSVLQEMIERRQGGRDKFAMVRDLRAELAHVFTHAPGSATTADDVAFRVRLRLIYEQELSRLEAELTAGFRHLPGVRK